MNDRRQNEKSSVDALVDWALDLDVPADHGARIRDEAWHDFDGEDVAVVDSPPPVGASLQPTNRGRSESSAAL